MQEPLLSPTYVRGKMILQSFGKQIFLLYGKDFFL